jgi:hypothetical protein
VNRSPIKTMPLLTWTEAVSEAAFVSLAIVGYSLDDRRWAFVGAVSSTAAINSSGTSGCPSSVSVKAPDFTRSRIACAVMRAGIRC